MSAELRLVGRDVELTAVNAVVSRVADGCGGAILVTGEAGIGKSRLLAEARRGAARQGLLVLRGRAVESGGAYRPLVEAFARAAAPFADDPRLAGVRPVLARVLPGWLGGGGDLAPMADPSAVLAQALTIVLGAIAPAGSVLLVDDLHWADQDTLSVLSSLLDATEELPLGLVMAARDEPTTVALLERLTTIRSLQVLPLRRLTSAEVATALRRAEVERPPNTLEAWVAAVDGLPLILDELVRQAREDAADISHLGNAALATAVRQRLSRLTTGSREAIEVLSVVGETDADLIMAVANLTESQLTAALHEGLTSTLLVTGGSPLGATWRHPLIRDVVRESLLPLEQQAYARRGADWLAHAEGATDGQRRLAATLYELAGYPHRAAQELIAAARLALRGAALGAAEQYLSAAQQLTGEYPEAAREVLIESIETLSLAGRAADGYQNGVQTLGTSTARENGPLLVATARAAFAAGLSAEGLELVSRLEADNDPNDVNIAVLRARAAYRQRRDEAVALGEQAAAAAAASGRFDLSCEALTIVAATVRRTGFQAASRVLHRAHELSRAQHLTVWETRILAELGLIDVFADSDATRVKEARSHAVNSGMVGLVAELDMMIAATVSIREGYVAAYPLAASADTEAHRLRLTALCAQTKGHLAECVAHAGDLPLPGWDRPATRADFDTLIAEAFRLGAASLPVPWVKGVVGLRAWLDGDSAAAIRLISDAHPRAELRLPPWWGVGMLLRVVAGEHPDQTFGGRELFGHHGNQAAYSYGVALLRMRSGRSVTAAIEEAEHHVRQAPFLRHLLRTIVAPSLFEVGFTGAEQWLREADAWCVATRERALQRRVLAMLARIGAKVPRHTTAVPATLARLGFTARETEILHLVNAGMSNADIARQLVISVRTVESHVSSILLKSRQSSRDQLRSALRHE